MVSRYAPLFVVIFELVVNKVQMKLGLICYQLAIFVVYMLVTELGGVLFGQTIFPNAVNWQCTNNCWS